VPPQLLSNGGIVHIARKRELTELLAAADSDQLEAFCELLKHRACVLIAIKKCPQLLKAAAEKIHIDIVREWLKICASVKISKKRNSLQLTPSTGVTIQMSSCDRQLPQTHPHPIASL
jgi:hypothetical protein